MMSRSRTLLVLIFLAFALAAASCGSASATDTSSEASSSPAVTTGGAEGLRQVSTEQAAEIAANPPAGLVVLDVRTPEEFAEGHLDGALMVDFYEEYFRERLADLDPNEPYLLYCRSGNRSGQTIAIMEELGFTDVADVQGGINAWNEAGHPLSSE